MNVPAASLRSRARRGSFSLFRLHPRIVLEQCGYCVKGQVSIVRNGRVTQQTCANCAGHGTVVVEV